MENRQNLEFEFFDDYNTFSILRIRESKNVIFQESDFKVSESDKMYYK